MKIKPFYKISVREEIQQIKKPTIDKIKQEYGELGVDIFQNKSKISIVDNNNNTKFRQFVSKLEVIFGFQPKFEYAEGDSMYDIVFKYVFNKEQGTKAQILTKLGSKGVEKFEKLKLLGYVE